ncbi:MAG TPA: DUF4962 domain-containing protein [Polyangiaceae bacterium]
MRSLAAAVAGLLCACTGTHHPTDTVAPPEEWPTMYTPPTETTVLSTLRSGHPKLIQLDKDIDAITARVNEDPVPAGYLAALRTKGDNMIAAPVSERVLVGPRLLAISRTVLDRVYTLALLYRLGHEQPYLDRARAELLHVAGFSDWNPSHFLDVAEMTHAFAIGYDWLYPALSAEDRAIIRDAIVQKGLLPAQQAYQAGAWWTGDAFNWNNVCNGGIAVGALAVADEEPTLAAWLLYRNIKNLPAALASYAPDGAWAEGPAYWGYATQYTVAMFAALNTALGTDFGLSSLPGLAEAGFYRVSVVGPTGKFFNFADSRENAGADGSLLFLGHRYDQPLLAYQERLYAGTAGSHHDLMWYDPRGTEADILAVPTDTWFRGADVVLLRSSWVDPFATWVGFKGGDNQANHSHLDLGTFVIDALGQRWAMELGPDDYNLPGYFGAQRYTYYRLGTRGQNTLELDDANQDENAAAPVTFFFRDDNGARAIADLTAAYRAGGAARVMRGMALLEGRNRVLLRDEITTSKPVQLVWSMHTQATIAVSETIATLSLGGKTLQAELLSPPGAVFTWTDVVINPPETPATGIRKLQVMLTGVTQTDLTVLFTPEGAPTSAVVPRPLDGWETGGPVQ